MIRMSKSTIKKKKGGGGGGGGGVIQMQNQAAVRYMKAG